MTQLLPRAGRRSRFLVDWSADACLEQTDQVLDALSDQAASFSRASIGTYIDAAGRLGLAAHSQPRVQWLDLDGDGIRETPGLLLEPARTNQWTFSRDLTNAVWTKTGVTLSQDGTAGPDGVTAADRVTEDTGATEHSVTRGALGTLSDNKRTAVSWAVKSAGRTWVVFRTQEKTGNTYDSYFNLSTGQLGTQTGSATAHAVTIEPLENGWWLVKISWDVKSGATSVFAGIYGAEGDGTGTNYTGDGTSACYLTDLQCESDADYASSFIPTAGATVARSADELSLALGLELPDALTVYVQLQRPTYVDLSGTLDFTAAFLWTFGTSSPYLGAQISPSGTHPVSVTIDNTSPPAVSVFTAVPAGDPLEVLAQFRTLHAGGQVNLDVGAGLVGWSSAYGAPLFDVGGTRTLYLGDRNAGGLQPGVAVTALRVAAGLRSLATMRAA